ncbi:membrane protein [Mycolicibacterium conceptionense]|jgi:RND superfamily putative drug exporter|uniref:Membrane protein n=3 Tax=Mycolicibacterium TaxID=1866885 RepID=A0ABR5FY53_9MYCO|nr:MULTISPECIES: RND family transporter [Mycolicibacterium]KLI09034.1 membrane protein [Mycolicibacterium senegalense]KLO52888.1 membrane protein [Mycolicibacterium senegalense]KMV17385.1 membrane protein [Mycolicibacterium conceptionense]
MLGTIARAASRYALLVMAVWVLLAGVGNVAVPQLEHVVKEQSRAFFPTDSGATQAAQRMGTLFGDSDSNNIAYVVLEADRTLGEPDRAYYRALAERLRTQTPGVESVMDLWDDPAAAAVFESRDHKAAYLMARLSGQLGSSTATEAVAALRGAVDLTDPPEGLRTHVTGPGASLVDEFAALDAQLARITVLTVGMIAALLLFVYRSPITAAVPLASVGLSLAVARPVVALLGEHGVIEVSVFSVALMSAMVLGAGTDYGIFLLGRYHENRRAGLAAPEALADAYRRVAPVIAGSSATIATALFCLTFAKVSFLRSAGIPSGIGILAAMLGALTLTPAMIGWFSRRGRAEPRVARINHRWRRIGTAVARWPGPVLVTAAAVLIVCTVPLLGAKISFAELSAQPATTDSSRGYQAMHGRFPDNRLLPEIVSIQADRDLRTPAGLITIERVTRKVLEVRGVRTVQSASRPAGTPVRQGTLAYQAGQIGEQLDGTAQSALDGMSSVDTVTATIGRLDTALDGMQRGLAGAVDGLNRVGAGSQDIGAGMSGLQGNLREVSGYADPLRQFVNGNPDCAANPICAAVQKIVKPLDDAVSATGTLAGGAGALRDGATSATNSLDGTADAVVTMRGALSQLRGLTSTLRSSLDTVGPQMRQMTGYLSQLSSDFAGSPEGGFYLPPRTFDDPEYRRVMDMMFSPDGHATRLLVYGDGESWGQDGADRSDEIRVAAAEALKDTPLAAGGVVDLTGVGTATAELIDYVQHDFALLVLATLVLIFVIVAGMLRSPVAGIVVLATVTVSYASALGASVAIWQFVLGQPLHWAVPALAFIALVAVGADYNLLLAMRLRDEAAAGVRTATIRAFAGTGSVVTIAGIVFGLTMFAMLGASVVTIAQVGSTIGIGLMIDTLVVRTFVVPPIAVLLGRWFWWPRRPLRSSRRYRREHRSVAPSFAPPR